jgi:hypothetical protein
MTGTLWQDRIPWPGGKQNYAQWQNRRYRKPTPLDS